MKKFYLYIPTLLFFFTASFFLIGCDDDVVEPSGSGKTTIVRSNIKIENIEEDATSSSITVKFIPDESVVKYRYAIGLPKDQDAFSNGSMEEIITVEGNTTTTQTFENLQSEKVYIVYAQSEDKDGKLSDIIEKSVETLEGEPEPLPMASVECEILELTVIYSKIRTTPNEECSSYISAMMSKELYPDFLALLDNDPVDLMETLYMADMANLNTGEAIETWHMNGFCDYEMVFLILPYDKEGKPASSLIEKSVKAPGYTQGVVLPDLVDIDIPETTPSQSRIVFTEGDNTFGFYSAVYTAEAFDEMLAEGEDYVINMLYFEGDLCFGVDDYYWEIPTGSYVATAVGFNINGHDGFGELNYKRFSVPASAPAMQSFSTLVVPDKIVRYGKEISSLKSLDKQMLDNLKSKIK